MKGSGVWIPIAAAVALLAALATAGSKAAHPAVSGSVPAAAGLPGPARTSATELFDVRAVVRRAHFAFRKQDRRFAGGHSTYAVEVESRRVSVRPVQPRPPLDRPELVLETRSIARRAGPLPLSSAGTVDDTGRLVRPGTGVQEVLENRDDGLELSWTFPARPSGSSDLVVRLAASGLGDPTETASGLHFRGQAVQAGLRFTHAAWIDGGGRRTEVAARWEHGEIVMRVPGRVVENSSYPAVLDPIVGPETALDVPVTGPATGDQYSAAVAFDPSANVYLAAWQDARAFAFSTEVFATRISSAGVVLDPDGIAVSALGSGGYSPSVVFDGTSFLIVFGTFAGVNGRRYTSAGTAVDAAPFPVRATTTPGQYGSNKPHAANDGSTTLVVWSEYRDSTGMSPDVYGTRLSGNTSLDGAAGFAISIAVGAQIHPRVASASGQWLVAWDDARGGPYAARVSSAGTTLDPGGIAVATDAVDPADVAVASDGSDYLVVWAEHRNQNPENTDIYGARVTFTGSVVDEPGIRICDSPFPQRSPSVAFGGGSYGVVWTDVRGPGLYGNRVDPATGALQDGPAGVRLDAGTIQTAVQQPRIFTAGTGFYLSWQVAGGESGLDVLGARMTSAATLQDLGGLPLTRSANSEQQVALAADAANYFVVWRDDRGGEAAIYGARIDGATGASMDPAGILLSAGGLGESYPSVAYNGTQYLVIWYDSRSPNGIYGTRVTTEGTVVDPAALALFTNAPNVPYAPASVASDGANWFVTWADGRNQVLGRGDMYGGRVSNTGTVLDPSGIVISNEADAQLYPHVAYGGGFYLVVWEDTRYGGRPVLYGARVNTAGVVQENTASNIAIESVGNLDGPALNVAYAPPNFMVAYSKNGILTRARVAAATGIVLDRVGLAGTGLGSTGVDITYDSDTFLVLYLKRSGGPGGDILGTRVSTAGVDLDPTDWTVATATPTGYPPFRVAATSGTIGRALVVYPKYDPTPGVTSNRMRARLLTPSQYADLAVTKSDGRTTVAAGAAVTYTIVASNGGPSGVTGASVTDTVPAAVSGVTWTCVGAGGGSCEGASGSGSLDETVNLPVGATVTYTLTGTLSTGASGTLTNSARISPPSGVVDNNSANDVAVDTDTIVFEADLMITKSDGRSAALPGQSVTYTIVVSNPGPSHAMGATVSDSVPASLLAPTWTCTGAGGGTCGAASGTGSIAEVVNLPAGSSVTYLLSGTIEGTASGNLSNTATISAPGGVTDPDPSNDSATDTDPLVLLGPDNDTAFAAKNVEIGSTSTDSLGLAPDDQNWFRYNVRAGRSYCVEVDNGESEVSIRDTVLEVYRGDTTTLVGANDDAADEPSAALLSRVCYIAAATEDNVAKVTAGASAAATSGRFRVRVVETTIFCAWVSSGNGFEAFVLIKNTTGTAHGVTVRLISPNSGALGTQSGTAPANGSYNLQVSAAPPAGLGLPAASGSVAIAHDGPPGALIAHVTMLSFGAGASYDAPVMPRPDARP